MTQEIAGSMMLALMGLALALALWGWRRRVGKYRDLAASLIREKPTSAALFDSPALYVATTEKDKPIDRVAAGPLSYRAKVDLALFPEGLCMTIPGEEPVLMPSSPLLEAGAATWTIDRVVEPDGMVMIRWQLGERSVDSYFRIVDGDSLALIAAVGALGKETQ